MNMTLYKTAGKGKHAVLKRTSSGEESPKQNLYKPDTDCG